MQKKKEKIFAYRRTTQRERERPGVCPDTRSVGNERGCGRMDYRTGAKRGTAMYAVEADRWGCEVWPRYIVAEPLLKLLSVLLLSGNVGPRKCHFREIGRGPPHRRKYISRPPHRIAMATSIYPRRRPLSPSLSLSLIRYRRKRDPRYDQQ